MRIPPKRPPLRVLRSAPGCLLATLALVGLLLVAGCGWGGPIRWDLHPEVQRPQPGVVIFLVDSLPPRFVEQGCEEGWLPNIQKRFFEGGTRVRHATTCIPGITYAAITTLLTGASPGQHRITGNYWFDPDQALFRNYATIKYYRAVNDDFDLPTLYERIHPATSVSIQAGHHRGVTKNIANWAGSGVRWFFGDYTSVDKLTATAVWLVAHWANQQRRWPTVLTCYFPGVDSTGHEFGASSAEFREAIEHADHQIGRVCNWLEGQGLLETTYLALVSDHGMVDVSPQGRIDLLHLVRNQWGRNATNQMLQDGTAAQRRRFFDRFDTVVAYHDGRAASLHFRGPAGWGTRPGPELVEAIVTAPPEEARLWNIPGVELVTYLASDTEAVLRRESGQARLLAREGLDGPEYKYLPGPDDVLGYLEDADLAAFVAAGYHDSRAWLQATAQETFPDVVPQLIPLLHVSRAGQVVAFTQPSYSFIEESGGHGGIHRDEMLMTFMLAGPGIQPGGTIDVARSVDLLPTLLRLLGAEPGEDEWLEGVPLLCPSTFSTAAVEAAR